MNWYIVLAAVLGAVTAWSLDVAGVYNPIDKLVDLFRTEQQKINALIKKGETIVIDEYGKVKK